MTAYEVVVNVSPLSRIQSLRIPFNMHYVIACDKKGVIDKQINTFSFQIF